MDLEFKSKYFLYDIFFVSILYFSDKYTKKLHFVQDSQERFSIY